MTSMSPSGLHVNKPVVAIILGVIVIGIIYFKMPGSKPSSKDMEFPQKESLKDAEKPQESGSKVDDLKSVKVTHVTDLKFKVGEKDVTIAYRKIECECAEKLDVLFLHGKMFKSETWVSDPIYTLQLLYKTDGFRAVAIDLPGYGDSPKVDVDPALFLEAAIAALGLKAPVIVSPSMSGGFSLPYLFKDPKGVLSRAKGFVPVAPVGTGNYKPEQYKELQIPTLVIYGEMDTSIGKTSRESFENLPKRTIVELPGAQHACYMDKPEEFHKHLIEFLNSLK